jgi:hypothetical protein
MRIVITESQKRRILLESTGEELGNVIKQNANRIKKIVDEAQGQIGMNLQFLLTWGAGIGGFVGPIEDFVKGRFPELNEMQITLILIGVIATYFFENKKFVSTIYNKIQEEGLSKVFEKVLKKSDELRSTFLDFIESLGIVFHKITNMMSYTFIIPLIPMIYQMAADGLTDGVDLKQLTTRIIGFTGLTISGILFKEMIVKMVRRFRGK